MADGFAPASLALCPRVVIKIEDGGNDFIVRIQNVSSRQDAEISSLPCLYGHAEKLSGFGKRYCPDQGIEFC